MMEFIYQRSYRGQVKLVVLDWAGTTLDYGRYAPAVVLYGARIFITHRASP